MRTEITVKVVVPTELADGIAWEIEKLFMGVSASFALSQQVLPPEPRRSNDNDRPTD